MTTWEWGAFKGTIAQAMESALSPSQGSAEEDASGEGNSGSLW